MSSSTPADAPFDRDRDRDWQRLARFARRRSQEFGDLYGWSRVEDPVGEHALLLVSEDASPADFPSRIGSLAIRLKHVPEPKELS